MGRHLSKAEGANFIAKKLSQRVDDDNEDSGDNAYTEDNDDNEDNDNSEDNEDNDIERTP